MGSTDDLNGSIHWNNILLVYLEQLIYRKSEKKEQNETKTNIVKFIENNMQQRLHFIEESLQYKDYKPFFTDM